MEGEVVLGNLIIHPIFLFEMNSDKSSFTYRQNQGTRIMLPGYIWYLEGVDELVVVDAGGDAAYMWSERKIPAREIQTLGGGLGKYNLRPEDIDIVILTHLHQDHVALASYFTKARFIVQKDEIEFARNPHPVFAASYEKRFFDELSFEIIDGDADIKPGVSVMKSPGHSPGGQSVVVRTAKGTAVISGLCTIRENFEPPQPNSLPVLTPGIHSDPMEAYDSLVAIKKLANTVIPLHDSRFQNVESIP
jgi:glyoxylase-like metal-dependent hydrolase (beta-lactamase superfamily II)